MSEMFWARVRDAFEAAIDVPLADQAAMLEAMSGGDAMVLRAATDLLAADSEAFLSSPPVIPGDVALLAARIPPGALIGDYRVVRLVGRGGMGEVYEGVRAAGDFDKRVAIKLLRAGMASAVTVGRFERERRILARLEHRNVASLLDGGVVADGTPFLVMEYVQGDRITDWCDRNQASLADRLALFRQVCAAVSYAHRNLVVHRDLKPGNILVTADGSVKLLDFGIAKVLDADAALGDAETRPEARALTREYAAPEHLTDGPITTGTDVYALGVLLFELLTGRRPFAGQDLSFVDYVRLVTTQEPPAPSTVESPPGRGLLGARGRDRVRGDLDAIVLRALRTSPIERYGTVEELANDLRRFEQGLPVLAVRGRRLYRARKFVRRNRGALATGSLIAALLIAGGVATRSQARRANAERDRAEATNQFLTEMLQSVDPGAQGRGVLMSEVLDSAAHRIDREPPREPEIEASLRSAIGASYMALGKYAAAEPHVRRALALREQHPDDVLALVNAVAALASLHDSRGEYVRADSEYHRALDLLPRSADSAVARRAADLVNQLARMQSQQGHYADAVKLLRQAIDRESTLFGPASLAVARTTGDLGLTLLQKGDIAAADSAESSAIRTLRSLKPRDLILEGNDLGRLATALDYEGNAPRSDSAYRASLAILDSILGPDHPDDTWIRYNYAGSLLAWGQAKPALVEADQVLALRGRTLPETHPILASVLIVKGQALGKLGEHVAAARAIAEGLALRQRYLAPDHWLVGSAESILGDELWAGGEHAEALRMLSSGCRIVLKALGPDHPKTKEAMERLRKAGEPAGCN